MRVAVVADDAGLASSTDTAILRCARSGIVTSASVVANGPAAEAFAGAARDAGLELGVHLNLTSGPPLSGSARTLRECGCFGDDKFAAWSGLARRMCEHVEVLREVSAQIERVAALAGVAPAHVNGHNHVHVLPAVRDAVAAACARCCPAAWQRVPEGFRPESHEALFAAALASAPRIPRTEFAGHGFILDPTVATFLREIDRALASGADFCEFMVHPGAREGTLLTSSNDRKRETDVLCDPALREALAARGIELVPVAKYRDR